jgi:23S rRNA pseudouridine2605 synthase
MTVKPIIKVLTGAGLGSRRRLAEAIKQGKVQINQPVDVEKDRISFDGKAVDIRQESIICLMLNKPAGVVSTVSDEQGRRTVLDILPLKYRKHRLYPVGRLDKDTSGLLLLTNDGDLTYRLTHPRYEYEKEYIVQVKSKLKSSETKKLEQGIILEDGLTHPARVKSVSSSPPCQYSITIHEGRKRQVRRMFERLGHPVLSLKRVRVGNLTLGDLKEGETRRLRPEDIDTLLEKR